MRVQLVVSGRVQGVGFRYAATREAWRLGVTGWVRNTNDGQVEIVAEGTPEAISQFVTWAGRGPAGAVVTKVERRDLDPGQPLPDFRIR